MEKYKFLLIILGIGSIILLFPQCKNSKKEKKPTQNTTPRQELKEVRYSFENPPKFRQDGELNFIDSTSNEIIFKINIEIVSTDMERALGLMFRPEMDEDKGMLFLMDKEERQSFYMRNTIIPLDIIYVNSKFQIVDIYKNTKILDDSSLPSAAPARYVVEINGGLCDKYNIKVGDSIYF